MRAYYFDNLPGDQRLPHDCVPSKPVSFDTLTKLGIKYWSIPVDGYEPTLDVVAREQGWTNRNTYDVSKKGMGAAYEETIKGYFQEHMHEDDEIRYILSGSGFWDIRESPTEAWIRLAIGPGDLLVTPGGLYHRFTLDEANNIKALRLFHDDSDRIPFYRSAATDVSHKRIKYLSSLNSGIPVGAAGSPNSMHSPRYSFLGSPVVVFTLSVLGTSLLFSRLYK